MHDEAGAVLRQAVELDRSGSAPGTAADLYTKGALLLRGAADDAGLASEVEEKVQGYLERAATLHEYAVEKNILHKVRWEVPGPLGIRFGAQLDSDSSARLTIEAVMPTWDRREHKLEVGMRIYSINDIVLDWAQTDPEDVYDWLRSTSERPLTIAFAAPPGMTIRMLRIHTALKAMRGFVGSIIDRWRVNHLLATHHGEQGLWADHASFEEWRMQQIDIKKKANECLLMDEAIAAYKWLSADKLRCIMVGIMKGQLGLMVEVWRTASRQEVGTAAAVAAEEGILLKAAAVAGAADTVRAHEEATSEQERLKAEAAAAEAVKAQEEAAAGQTCLKAEAAAAEAVKAHEEAAAEQERLKAEAAAFKAAEQARLRAEGARVQAEQETSRLKLEIAAADAARSKVEKTNARLVEEASVLQAELDAARAPRPLAVLPDIGSPARVWGNVCATATPVGTAPSVAVIVPPPVVLQKRRRQLRIPQSGANTSPASTAPVTAAPSLPTSQTSSAPLPMLASSASVTSPTALTPAAEQAKGQLNTIERTPLPLLLHKRGRQSPAGGLK